MDKALWDLSQYWMDQAKRCIRSAKVLAEDANGAATQTSISVTHINSNFHPFVKAGKFAARSREVSLLAAIMPPF